MIIQSETKILKVLESQDMIGPGLYVQGKKVPLGISFTELLQQSGISRQVLSEDLRKLQKAGLIQRNIDTRKYYLTEENGEVAFKILDIIEMLSQLIESADAK